jgi:ATP-dependent helicase HepA
MGFEPHAERQRPAALSDRPSAGRPGSLVVGQLYISEPEPELGLGVVVAVDEREVELAFAAAAESRRYVLRSAPLQRVRFVPGDAISDVSGTAHRIEEVENRAGVLFYRTDHGELAEARIAARTSVAGPRTRLLAGRVDASDKFDLRAETLTRLHEIRSSPVRGFAGPRIELLPHQFFVAAETSSRLRPRVLLADETGLGKTIEAGLILSRLVLAGRAARVLVVVPDALVHQWLVELRRRFQLRFAVYDESRCRAVEESEPGANPFAQEQLVLAGLSLLTARGAGAEADSAKLFRKKRKKKKEGDLVQAADEAAAAMARPAASRAEQAAEAGWDMVVVDEAHHLEWSSAKSSEEYDAVERLARQSSGLLLLTATPEQLGAEGHFARLRLLDPDRYGDFETWSREAAGYRDAAHVAVELIENDTLPAHSIAELARLLGLPPEEVVRRAALPAERSRMLAGLIDRHGPGRVMFRNTRAAVSGFPQRVVHRHALDPAGGEERLRREDAASVLQRLDRELASDLASRRGAARKADGAAMRADEEALDEIIDLLGETDNSPVEPDDEPSPSEPSRSSIDDESDAARVYPTEAGGASLAGGTAEAGGAASSGDIDSGVAALADAGAFVPVLDADPRVEWLAGLLAPDGPRKVLVICSSAAKAEAIEAALATRIRVATALFHEGLTLLQRDRNAAWFAEEDGARLMICSELGSEGRNFQHAQDLVLFDVPLNPDLVEQRIGRLDRIGQRGVVQVHAPFVRGSGQEVLLRWLDEGVNALRQPTLAAHALLERFGERVRTLALAASRTMPEDLWRTTDELIAETVAAQAELAARVEKGRDRLLEMASLRRDVADPLIEEVRRFDADPALEDYFLRILEHFHVYAEEHEPRRYLLNPDGTQSPEFPSLDSGQTVLTFDRETALVREDLTFATRDHPLLGDAMEALVASQSGNSAFAMLEEDAKPRLWLEALFVLEPVAPPRLHADRFLAPTPLRIVLDQHLREAGGDDPTEADLTDGRGAWIADNEKTLAPLFGRMLARCDELAEERAAALRKGALAAMDAQLGGELERLAALAAVNANVRADEKPALEEERRELALAIGEARLRPDSLRVVWQGPVKAGQPLLAKR